MKTSKFYIILIFVLSFSFISCNFTFKEWVLPPNELYFIVLENNQPLDKSINDSIRCFYISSEGERVYSAGAYLRDTSILYSAYGWIDNGNQPTNIYRSAYLKEWLSPIWYLEYPNGDIDSFEVKTKQISSKKGRKDRCYCNDPYVMVKFNGKEAPEYLDEKATNGKIIYRFDR